MAEKTEEDADAPDERITISFKISKAVLDEVVAAIPIRYSGQDVRFQNREGADLLRKLIAVTITDLVQGTRLQKAAAQAEELRQAALASAQEITRGLDDL